MFLLASSATVFAQTLADKSDNSNAVESEDFYRIYDYETSPQGWFEPNFWITHVPKSRGDYGHFYQNWDRGHLTALTSELEYGVTDRLSVSAYVDLVNAQADEGAHTPGTGLRFTQGRIEALYRLASPGKHFFNTAAYLEYHLPAKSYSASQELETRLILERDVKSVRLDFNPTLSFLTTGSAAGSAPSLNFNTGAYYRRYTLLQPGMEYYSGYGALDNVPATAMQQHVLFATTDCNPRQNWDLQVGVGYGLTHQSDTLTIKTILSYQFSGIPRQRFLTHEKH